MTPLHHSLLAAAIATGFLLPAATNADAARNKRTKLTVHSTGRWHGYGFLPGYRPSPAETQGLPMLGPPPPRREVRYIDYYGNLHYGWGRPGFYRGQYNGGSFGPCWTSTPIGMMPTCGQ
jgi:hypothetical protein